MREGQQIVQANEESQPIENRWAFLVGVNDYSDSEHFPHLNFCRNDVMALRDLLEQVGYTVTCLHDGLSWGERLFPSHRSIRARLQTLCEDVGPNDLLWVYFACHGTRQGDKKPRLVAADTYSDDLGSFISVAEVEELMRSSGSKRLVLMLDACHIGVGTDNRSAVLADPAFIRNVYDLATGFALIAASTDQQSAFEHGGHGVFSSHVLSGLREGRLSTTDPNQNFVTVGSLQRYVLHRLKEWRNKHGYQQKPQSRADGDLGEMILVDYRKYSMLKPPEAQQKSATIAEPESFEARKVWQQWQDREDWIELLRYQQQLLAEVEHIKDWQLGQDLIIQLDNAKRQVVEDSTPNQFRGTPNQFREKLLQARERILQVFQAEATFDALVDTSEEGIRVLPETERECWRQKRNKLKADLTQLSLQESELLEDAEPFKRWSEDVKNFGDELEKAVDVKVQKSEAKTEAEFSSVSRGVDRTPQVSSANQVLVKSLQQRRQRLVQQLEAETAALNAASGGEVVRRQEAWNAVARQLQDIDDQLRGFGDGSRS